MTASRNQVLTALTLDDWTTLGAHAVRLRLANGAILSRLGAPARCAYFPESGLVSLLMPSADGETVQVAAVGAEGVVTPTVFDDPLARYEAIVALPSDLLRVDAERLRRLFDRSPALQRAFVDRTRALLVQVSQAAACHRFHTVEQRVARLLLDLRDHSDGETLELTHDFLARLLGTPRSAVSTVIGGLERSGIVACRRGRLRIVQRRALEPRACDCYETLRTTRIASSAV